jgi:threonine dehydratase
VAFVAPSTAPAKLSRLLASEALVLVCTRPINFARYASRVFGLPDLRGTKDPAATVGYRSIAGEVADEAPEADALFTFSSSGVSIAGIADGYDQLAPSPALWSIQSGECVGIVRALYPETPSEPGSPAGRLGIKNPPGAEALARRLAGSGGGARAISGDDVRSWQQHLRDVGVETSPEGAAVLAGISATPGLEGQQVVAILTGRAQDTVAETPTERLSFQPESYLDVRALLTEQLGLDPVV